MTRAIRNHVLRGLGALLGACIAAAPAHAADMLSLHYSFAQQLDGNYLYNFTLSFTDNDTTAGNASFNSFYVGDFRASGAGIDYSDPFNKSPLAVISTPSLPVGVIQPVVATWDSAPSNPTFNLSDPASLPAHRGWLLYWGNGTDNTINHGWRPNDGGTLTWNLTAQNKLNELYFSNTHGTARGGETGGAYYQQAVWDNPTSPAPEPGTYALMLVGIAAIAGVRMRRVRQHDDAKTAA